VPKQIYFWLALIWTVVIAVLCLVSFGNLSSIGLSNADKYVHFTLHFIFTGLWFLYFNNKSYPFRTVKIYFIVFLLSTFYGIGIEIMQSLFTIARKADVLDVFANTTGSLIAISIICIYQRVITKNKI
jgi:VanZ family protein